MRVECARCFKWFDAKVEDVKECLITERWITYFVNCPHCGMSVFSIGPIAGKYKKLKKNEDKA